MTFWQLTVDVIRNIFILRSTNTLSMFDVITVTVLYQLLTHSLTYVDGYDCRLIQEEKETAELRAEELESRVAVDTLPANWRPEVVYDRSSPPLSGRSTPSPRPSLQSHDYMHKYHTLNSAVSQLLSSNQILC